MKVQKPARTITIPLTIIAIILVVYLLKVASSVFIPIVCAMFLYLLFVPLANKLDSRHVPRVISTIIVLLILFLILTLIFHVLTVVTTSVASSLPEYYNRVVELDSQLSTWLNEHFDSEAFKDKSLFDVFNINWTGMIASIVSHISNLVLTIGKSIGLIFVYLLFLMIERGSFVKKIMKFYPDEQGRRVSVMTGTIIKEVQRYLVIKTIISLATGICVGLICYFVGYNLYFLAGLMAFAFNYIPSIGSIVVTILITIMSALQFLPNLIPVAIILGGIIITEMVIGNLIDPKVSGDQLNISPFMILLSLAMWGYIWGVIGMLFSVPFVSILRIVSSHVKQLKFMELLLSNPKETLDNSKKKKKANSDDDNFVFGDEDKYVIEEADDETDNSLDDDTTGGPK